ncbi:daptide biosynthesis RiPP recognition protein [Yimella sp. NH-Cas1]|uniref:daptide biosynthesis RiPP recognition protein n=1 Tax=Yimella sp. NH-Cas1 TaxID=2917726 RepID=UPI001EFA6B80|nr:daptide biosynthesis RiPP recognition protein [Yimella sp. NH-Cas1]MCG8654527.1 hypothetical protein [Yimella sp. NH-Cas1]
MNKQKTHLMSWMTGRSYGLTSSQHTTRTLVLENGTGIDQCPEGLLDAESVVYVPIGTDVPESFAAHVKDVVPYDGSMTELGGEAGIGPDFFLQTQSYSVAGFLVLLGPTAVRLDDDEDVDAFTEDARSAVESGEFPDFLTNPIVQLADAARFSDPLAVDDGPALRLLLDGDSVRLGPNGVRAESTDWTRTRLSPTHPLTGQLETDPWLTRYVVAVQAIQQVTARGAADVEVSGFGMRFGGQEPATTDADFEKPLLPVLLRVDGDPQVYLPAEGRLLRGDHDAVTRLEASVLTGEAAA